MSSQHSSSENQEERAKSARFLRKPIVIIFIVLLGAWSGCLIFMDQLYLLASANRSEHKIKPSMELDPSYTDEQKLMYSLSHRQGDEAIAALQTIVENDDKRFIPVLVEMLYANEHQPTLYGAGEHRHINALETLTGERLFASFKAGERISDKWVAWYAKTDLTPPPGFQGWKGDMLGRVDPKFAEILQTDTPIKIRAEEILSGGVGLGRIPALDHPNMTSAAEAVYLNPDDPVFGITINGDSRAYPQRILDWHEMMNDEIGGVPVSLAYCTLCGAGIAFDGRAGNGKTYTFGSSGLLYRNNKLMYDRESMSLWNHFTGKPVVGELAATDVKLKMIPVVVTRWKDWHKQNPETRVLAIDTGFKRRYNPGAAYGTYFESEETMFPLGLKNGVLPLKKRIYGLRLDAVSKAFPLEVVTQQQVVNDVVGTSPVVIVTAEKTVVVNGTNVYRDGRRQEFEYNAGGEIRAFLRGKHVFRPGPDAMTLLDEGGKSWKVTEQVLVGPDEQTVPRIQGVQSYWFAWYAFNQETEIYDEKTARLE